ncbi:NB-ARC domain-containing protein [Aromatoleum diolicum]|uniref:NB-ARC domain-containing protein n=1 Tax=Aromatoleum diolicum TaxID=75796 RepID=A0ABX1QED0_9RHOO|nr:NB-ARC domain-containing protein [Aromatoleum diolicum]NMG76774.1 hypothetical protein [Aromatoleum diolicum]
MTPEQSETDEPRAGRAVPVSTNGGPYVGGNVNAGRDFVAGDQIVNIFQPHKAPPSPPFQALPPAADHVQRPHELANLKRYLIDGEGKLLSNTVALHGFGGMGKTTLARLFCADAEVRLACRDGILWVPLGKHRPAPEAQIADLVTALTGECSGCATLAGARSQLQAAVSSRTLLIVLDDVWDEAHIRDILDASAGCARLITTRKTETLPFDAILMDIAAMHEQDARQLLGAGLPTGEDARLDVLVRQLGSWPVLLRLANRTLRQSVLRQKTPFPKALDAIKEDLARKGVVAFDPRRDVTERDQAVAATVDVSLVDLEPDERQRYGELSLFPQDVPIPLSRAAELWGLIAGMDEVAARTLITSRIEPLALLDYNGETETLALHDVLRSYVSTKLPDRALLHLRLAEHWGDTPTQSNAYAWRWLAFHRAQAARLSVQPRRHQLTESLVRLTGDVTWQQGHEDALQDLPALREALSWALDAAVANDETLGVPLVVESADTLVSFRRDHLRPGPIFELARGGQLDAAWRRSALFAIDDHWRQALLLTLAWLAHRTERDRARSLCEQILGELGSQPALHDLVSWIRADLWDEPAPQFDSPVQPHQADEKLIEELLKRVGGGAYSRELIASRGLDADAEAPDPPRTRGLHRATDSADERSTTRYLAELDGPYLVAHAAADPGKGTETLKRYLSVYTNYNYPEYRFSTLWLLLGFVIRFPRAECSQWVQDAVLRILDAALGGGSVEFDQGLAIAVRAIRAQAGDEAARNALQLQAHELIGEAMRLKPGRDRAGSDIWAHHKRRMLASAQANGWLLGDEALAGRLLREAVELTESGFAGYQAPACLAVAEAFHVCQQGAPAVTDIETALEAAQRAAHNVQDPTFCARMTARVNAMRKYWWQGFDLEERARRLAEAAHLREFAAVHRVGHPYPGRRQDALKLPPWTTDDRSFAGLERLYQRNKADFLRLNGGERPLNEGDEVSVPDPGLVPHLAARLSAEMLAQAGGAPLPPQRLQLLRALVPYALLSPTALDAVLTRLVLAHARRTPAPDLAEATALEAVLDRRPPPDQPDTGSELIAGRLA